MARATGCWNTSMRWKTRWPIAAWPSAWPRHPAGARSMHPLDRPVWASLNSHLRPLGEGSPWARRFAPDVILFGAACDDGDEALAALADLLAPGEQVYLLQAAPIRLPPGLQLLKAATGVQMLATRDLQPMARDSDAAPVVALGDADAADMLALARPTEPGPVPARPPT